MQDRTSRLFVLGRITGLNPIQLSTSNANAIGRMSPSDAAFVETVYTENNDFGDHVSRGHVWFMVNGGKVNVFC